MKDYLERDEWTIREEGFHPEYNEVTESLMSLGNGSFGQRANFEEKFSGKSLQGNYVAGVYYPDKTRVGWWKNGYPEYFAKVLNNVNWAGLELKIDEEIIDLNEQKILSFERSLNMKEGVLIRSCELELSNGSALKIRSERFISMADQELGVLRYSFSCNREAKVDLLSYVDFDVVNQDSNYDEKFWEEENRSRIDQKIGIVAKTKKLDFRVCAVVNNDFRNEKRDAIRVTQEVNRDKYSALLYSCKASKDEWFSLEKRASILSSLNHKNDAIQREAFDHAKKLDGSDYESLRQSHIDVWAEKWAECDVKIGGDVAAQQGIRFNIFQLHQTYTGEDERLNIGPKGFTGEKYGGSTYWDTEAYCLPFYLSTSAEKVGRQLLMYRYRHLDKAIENAQKLGFDNGAALYPMVTMNGEECHNEWEITFEEIHRNGAIAYAIYHYTNYTNDISYLFEYGIEVLVGIARFWAQRVNWSKAKNAWVMLGVTGPNEFENNVNNNWYTNYIASWCLSYTLEVLNDMREEVPEQYTRLLNLSGLSEEELRHWEDVHKRIYYPLHPEKEGVYLQQDGFLDKELIPVSELPESERPLVEHWSWDRILRSVYIKQADVLQGLYFFDDQFEKEQIQANYDYYEPFTVHESSLSACIHSVIAARLGMEDKAYEYYLRTARLDLNDYNNDTKDGCHITSMAGSWLAVVQGFAGMKLTDGQLSFQPFLPNKWEDYSFRIMFRSSKLEISVSTTEVKIELLEGDSCKLFVYNKPYQVTKDEALEVMR